MITRATRSMEIAVHPFVPYRFDAGRRSLKLLDSLANQTLPLGAEFMGLLPTYFRNEMGA